MRRKLLLTPLFALGIVALVGCFAFHGARYAKTPEKAPAALFAEDATTTSQIITDWCSGDTPRGCGIGADRSTLDQTRKSFAAETSPVRHPPSRNG